VLTAFYGLFFLIALVVVLVLAFGQRLRVPSPSRFSLGELWTWQGRVGRGTYLAVGIIGFAIKHNIDRAVATLIFERPFGIFNYWVSPIEAVRISSISRNDAVFLLTMLGISLPFVWIGVGMTLRRLRSADLPLWLVFLFFVPVINIAFFLILSLVPDAGVRGDFRELRESSGSFIPDSVFGSAAMAVAVVGGVGALLVYIGVETLGVYGWGVFVALPFCMGLAAVMIHTYRRPRVVGSCVLVSLVAVALAAGVLLALAVEGLICIVMAVPIATTLALLGGIVGFLIQRGRSISAQAPSMMALVFVLPLTFMGLEKLSPLEPELITVVTTMRIDAPASRIWGNLIAFPDLPESDRWLFQLGVSHPIRATITGSGVGAIRECVFSTGTFVERIDAWEENRRMAFSVVSGADAMKEFSPYDIHPRHLDGYLAPERAEFTLTSNPDGSTSLEGRSWYRNSMWPSAYWRLWSDRILHDIHTSVFAHIKELSETSPPDTGR
jgi:uncharacterized membrane protein YhaH (DUF805 family)